MGREALENFGHHLLLMHCQDSKTFYSNLGPLKGCIRLRESTELIVSLLVRYIRISFMVGISCYYLVSSLDIQILKVLLIWWERTKGEIRLIRNLHIYSFSSHLV
jgi:hypothetical protein